MRFGLGSEQGVLLQSEMAPAMGPEPWGTDLGPGSLTASLFRRVEPSRLNQPPSHSCGSPSPVARVPERLNLIYGQFWSDGGRVKGAWRLSDV